MSEVIRAIEVVLRSDPLSERILRFLAEHEGAMDTIEGVAHCWVNSDPVAVRSALECLQATGILAPQVLGTRTYYRLTANGEIRAWLKAQYPHPLESRRVLATTNDG